MIIESVWKSYQKYVPEPDIDEFVCPALVEHPDPYRKLTTTETCENLSLGSGCKHLKTCPSYQRTKKLEKQYGDLTKLPESKKGEIRMILEGTIIPPRETEEQHDD